MKLLSRQEFKEKVFWRDKFCIMCGAEPKDAHHLIGRKRFKNGGYYLDNGVALCHTCHIKAEAKEVSAQELRKLAGIKQIILPTPFEGVRHDSRFKDI